MTPKSYEAGSHIESVCGDVVAKVQCNICGSLHKHRSPVSAKAAKKTSTRATGTAAKAPRQSATVRKYKEAIDEAGGTAIPYSIDRGFRLGDLLQHPTFGLGVVQKVTKPNKVDVLFEAGIKLLRCKL